MIKGFVSRRNSQRVPFEAEIGIQFACGDNTAIIANTTNLSSEGVRFFLPKGLIKLAPDEVIELSFKLPKKEEFTIQGEICYFSNAMDINDKPVVYYGVRFINLTPETADAIREFCQIQLSDEPAEDPEIPSDTVTSGETVNDFNPEMMDPAEFEISEDIQAAFQGIVAVAPQPAEPSAGNPLIFQPAMSGSPLQATDDHYRSLSQEMIDQIIRSMTSAQDSAAPVPDATPAEPVPHQQAAAAGETSASSGSQSEPLFQMENPQALFDQIRKIAESINIKIDDELFQKHTSLMNKPEQAAPTAPPPQAISASVEAGLSVDELNKNKPSGSPDFPDVNQTDGTSEHNLSSSNPFALPDSSLIELLYGNESDTKAQPAAPVMPEPAKTVHPPDLKPEVSESAVNHQVQTPQPEPVHVDVPEPKQPEISAEPETDHSSQNSSQQVSVSGSPPPEPEIEKPPVMTGSGQFNLNSIPKKTSGVPMDQRMIDQIVQSLLRRGK